MDRTRLIQSLRMASIQICIFLREGNDKEPSEVWTNYCESLRGQSEKVKLQVPRKNSNEDEKSEKNKTKTDNKSPISSPIIR